MQRLVAATSTEEAEVERFYADLQDLLELTPKEDVLFIMEDWNSKVGSQETAGVTSKFGLGVQQHAAAACCPSLFITEMQIKITMR